MEIDDIVFAVADLTADAREVETLDGLESDTGGRHPGLGTANVIVPLGAEYLELVAVADPQEASASAFDLAVGVAAGRPFAWVVRTDEVDAVAAGLGLAVVDGSRNTPDGRTLRWRM